MLCNEVPYDLGEISVEEQRRRQREAHRKKLMAESRSHKARYLNELVKAQNEWKEKRISAPSNTTERLKFH